MSATAIEPADTTERPAAADDEAQAVLPLLREYAGKLAALGADLSKTIEAGDMRYVVSRAAWLLDQSELTRRPLTAVLSRASGLREHSVLDPVVRDELDLRMTETEVHLHHATRLAGQLRSMVQSAKLSDQVAKLRYAAGLSGMKGGPLRPDN